MMKQVGIIVLTTLIGLILPPKLSAFNISLADSGPGKSNLKPANDPHPFRIKTIVIDAGHGGKDPGCLGGHSHEKHIALAIALQLAEKIEAKYPDVQVILTRDQDVFIPLHERAAIANRNQADLFISIHCNYMPGSTATRGSETYVMGLHTAEHNLDVAKRENSAILLEEDYEQNYDYDPNSPEGHILLSMFQNVHLEHSILFAEKVENHFSITAQRKSRGVKQAGFVVLKETAMPSVLVETGFLSSPKEEAFLMSEPGQSLVANAILQAFIEYKNVLEAEGESPATTYDPVATTTPPVEQPPAATYTAPPPPAPKQVAYTPPPAPAEERKPEPPVTYAPPVATAPPPTYPYSHPPSSSPPVQAERMIVPKGGQAVTTASRSSAEYDRANLPNHDVEGISFAVQLAAAPQTLDTSLPIWKNLGYLVEVVREDQLYKYQARNFRSLEQAFAARINLQSKGFQDAFILAYRNGERIAVEEAKRLLGIE